MGRARGVYAAFKVLTLHAARLGCDAFAGHPAIDFQAAHGGHPDADDAHGSLPRLTRPTMLFVGIAFLALVLAVKARMCRCIHGCRDAHVEAPTEGSVIIAGVLLKRAPTASSGLRCRCARRLKPVHAADLGRLSVVA